MERLLESDFKLLLRENGADLDWFRASHLSRTAVARVNAARAVCNEFMASLVRGEVSALILSSAPAPGTSGYGVGKTTLANIVHTMNCRLYYPDSSDKLRLERRGKFFTAAGLMAALGHYSADDIAGLCDNLLIIDDVGREGSIEYEKKEAINQAVAVSNRYYSIVNACVVAEVSIMMTTNLTSKELVNCVGGGAWSRLVGMGLLSADLSGVADYRTEGEKKNGSR